MRLTTEAFGAMTMELRAVAEECCEGRIALVTEGGYDLRALGDSLVAVSRVLAPPDGEAARWPSLSSISPSRGRTAVTAARAALAAFWQL
jgi:acetoin utilization deacetylase AcuC-like enzyme